MLPSAEDFAAAAGALGIAESDRIIVYDSVGIRSAPRVWWTFRVMGAQRVQVLDGGLPAWTRAGYPLESGPPSDAGPAAFQAKLRPELVRDLIQMRAAVLSGSEQIVDARPRSRFDGQSPEPRAGLRSGHMPGAVSQPFSTMLTADGLLKSESELRAVFTASGIDLDRPIATTCGSGITAAILALGLAVIGREAAVYDGSWSEWGSRPDTPVETTPPD